MKARRGKRSKDTVLLNVAESIGTALGTIAAKANAAQKALTRSRMVRGVERAAKRLALEGARSARKSGGAAAASLKRSKVAKATRRGVRRTTASVKRAARRI